MVSLCSLAHTQALSRPTAAPHLSRPCLTEALTQWKDSVEYLRGGGGSRGGAVDTPYPRRADDTTDKASGSMGCEDPWAGSQTRAARGGLGPAAGYAARLRRTGVQAYRRTGGQADRGLRSPRVRQPVLKLPAGVGGSGRGRGPCALEAETWGWVWSGWVGVDRGSRHVPLSTTAHNSAPPGVAPLLPHTPTSLPIPQTPPPHLPPPPPPGRCPLVHALLQLLAAAAGHDQPQRAAHHGGLRRRGREAGRQAGRGERCVRPGGWRGEAKSGWVWTVQRRHKSRNTR